MSLAARNLEADAAAIDAAVFDLKAVIQPPLNAKDYLDAHERGNLANLAFPDESLARYLYCTGGGSSAAIDVYSQLATG